jgi:hypothetical protein
VSLELSVTIVSSYPGVVFETVLVTGSLCNGTRTGFGSDAVSSITKSDKSGAASMIAASIISFTEAGDD